MYGLGRGKRPTPLPIKKALENWYRVEMNVVRRKFLRGCIPQFFKVSPLKINKTDIFNSLGASEG